MRELFVEKVIDTIENFLYNNQRIKLKEILTEICLNYQIEILEQSQKEETQNRKVVIFVQLSILTNNVKICKKNLKNIRK